MERDEACTSLIDSLVVSMCSMRVSECSEYRVAIISRASGPVPSSVSTALPFQRKVMWEARHIIDSIQTHLSWSVVEWVFAASRRSVDTAHNDSSSVSSSATFELPFTNDCKKYLQTFPNFSLLKLSSSAMHLAVLFDMLPTSILTPHMLQKLMNWCEMRRSLRKG